MLSIHRDLYRTDILTFSTSSLAGKVFAGQRALNKKQLSKRAAMLSLGQVSKQHLAPPRSLV